jgi:hypothetical protein
MCGRVCTNNYSRTADGGPFHGRKGILPCRTLLAIWPPLFRALSTAMATDPFARLVPCMKPGQK